MPVLVLDLFELLCVSSDREIVSLSVETVISDAVLFCGGFAFIFMPILLFLTKVDEIFLLDNDPACSDHNDTLEGFVVCSEFSCVTINNNFLNNYILKGLSSVYIIKIKCNKSKINSLFLCHLLRSS